jgi:serine/threonine-protein kinase
MSQRSSIGAATVLACFLVGSTALGDVTPQDRAVADSLYEQSAQLAKENRWEEACAKLEASLKLDPAIGTLLRLASCYEHQLKTASAWSAYNDAVALAAKSDDKRGKFAEKEAKRLEPTLAKLLVEVSPEGRAGLEIKRDGMPIAASAWGAPFPVDPGTITLECSQPGKRSWKTSISVDAKPGTTTVRVPALEDAPAPSPTDVKPPAPEPRSLVPGIVLAGVAAAGIGAGAALFAVSGGKHADAQAQSMQIVGAGRSCVPGATNFDTADCGGLHDKASAYATFHNAAVGVFVGAGVVAAGAATYLLWPNKRPESAAGEVRVDPVLSREVRGVSLSVPF